MITTFTWGFGDELFRDEYSRVAITVKTVTLAEIAAYQADLEELDDRYSEELGGNYGKMTQAQRQEIPAAVRYLHRTDRELLLIKTVTRKIIGYQKDGTKVDIFFGDLSSDEDGMLDMPSDLFAEWMRQCIITSPNAFGYEIQVDEKKKANEGLLSVE